MSPEDSIPETQRSRKLSSGKAASRILPTDSLR